MVIAVLPIIETGKFIHLFVSSFIYLINGLKFKCSSSDSLVESLVQAAANDK